MSLKRFLESCIRVARIISRPAPKDLLASIRISLIGLTILGVLGFIIKFLATLLGAFPTTV